MLQNLLLALIPVFVAVDALGVLPMFISMTQGDDRVRRNRIVFQSMVTALCLAVGFIFLGKAIFHALGISMGDFMIAGGIVLFCIAVMDILSPEKKRRNPGEQLGVVPLGTPLIVGPAVLTTSLVIVDEYGLIPTLLSVLINIVLAGTMFSLSGYLIRLLGDPGTKALSKITSLLLAAIAVMMVRKGLVLFIGLS